MINDKEGLIYKAHISSEALVWKICICKASYIAVTQNGLRQLDVKWLSLKYEQRASCEVRGLKTLGGR